MLKSKLRAFIAGVSNIVRSRRRRHSELILEGVLTVIKTVVINGEENIWIVNIMYPKKTRGYEYRKITDNYLAFWKPHLRQKIYDGHPPKMNNSPRKLIKNYLEGHVFIALDDHKYQIHVNDRDLNKIPSERKTTGSFNEYTLPVTISPFAGQMELIAVE
jgi:hypothetical protein